MSDYFGRAVQDTADAIQWTPQEVTEHIDSNAGRILDYAVSQRERVLELDKRIAELEAELLRAQTELIFVKNAPTLELASSAEGDAIIKSIEALLAAPEREKGKC